VNRYKLRVDCDEPSIYGVEPLVLRCKSGMDLAKSAFDQFCVLAKVLFEGFTAHTP
jgi:hypothetical protein